jgi:hypothetical protein
MRWRNVDREASNNDLAAGDSIACLDWRRYRPRSDAVRGIMFLGLPILGVVFILHKVERNFGPLVTYCIAALGLLPTLFVYLIAPMMGIHGGDQGYIFVLILSGLPWAIGWIVTSHKYRKNPGTNP